MTWHLFVALCSCAPSSLLLASVACVRSRQHGAEIRAQCRRVRGVARSAWLMLLSCRVTQRRSL
jgi:hypothetical protein